MNRVLSVVALSAIALAAGCRTDIPTVPAAPSFEIRDAVHGGGNRHFYFLAPLVSPPTFSGVFDATQSPEVRICVWSGSCGDEIAQFSLTSGTGSERLRVTDEHYLVNWHTGEFDLDPAATYRIRVFVAGTELAHADVDVVNSGKEIKNVNTGEFIPLLDGRTLPIKFRIEQGALTIVGAEGGTVLSEDGNVKIEVPAGALAGPTGFTVEPEAVSGSEIADAGLVPGAVYEFGPNGAVFPTPVVVTIHYDPAVLGGQAEDQLILLTKLGDKWAQIPNTTVDLEAHTVSAPVRHFSVVGVAAYGPTTIMPRSLAIVLGQNDVMLDVATTYTARLNTWSSGTPSVATINPVTGVLQPVSVGLAVIRVSVYDPAYQATNLTDEIYVAVLPSLPAANQLAWFTQQEGLTNAQLYGIHGIAANDFFVVGRGGTILRSNGVSFTRMTSSTTRTLFGVWQRTANDAYVVGVGAPGTGSSVQRFDGTNWNHIYVNTGVTVYGVHGNSRYAFVAAGDRVLRFDNAAGNPLFQYASFPAGTTIRAVAAEEDNDIVFAAGDVGGTGRVFKSIDNGVTFDAGVTPPDDFGNPVSGPITALWRDPTKTHVAAATLDGRILSSGSDGTFWGVNRRVAGSVFRALTSRPMGTGSNVPTPELIAGGDNGSVAWNYRCRCPIEFPGFRPDQSANQDINGMWTDPNGIAWGVGLSGFIFRQDVPDLHSFTVKSNGQPFADVWAGIDGHVVVASAAFKSEVFTTTSFGTTWRGTPLNPVNGIGFQGAYGAPGGAEVWVVGYNGAIARGTPTTTGYSFSNVNSGTTEELDDVWVAGLGSRPVYVVGTNGTVRVSRDRGATWMAIGSALFAGKQIAQVYGIADNDVFVAAEDGSVYRTQNGGTSWTTFRTGGGEFPTGLVVASPYEAYMGVAHAGLGKIVRMNNGIWQPPQTIAGTRFMGGVWRSLSGRVFVAGSNGTVVLSDDGGATWVPQVTNTTRDLFAITGSEYLGGRQIIFATGSAGTIIQGIRP